MVFARQFGLKDPSLIRTQGLVNGKWVDGEDGRTISVTSSVLLPPCLMTLADPPHPVDPANNAELGTVPEMTLAQTKEAIAAAGGAFKSWSKTTAKVSSPPCDIPNHQPLTLCGNALSIDTTYS